MKSCTLPQNHPAERSPATEALKVMQANHVNGLLVTDADGVLTAR